LDKRTSLLFVTAEFSVSAERLASGGLVVHVQGQVDLYVAPDLKERLLDALERGDGRIVVDVTESTFLDSTALSTLFSAHRRARRRGGRVVLVNTSSEIARTLSITGLDAILDVVETLAEARVRLDSGSGQPR
jgi:anti-sigma B factor antagonist